MKIGIIGAMDVEIERFNDLFNLTEVEKDIYEGNNVVVALSGIGKVNSAAITQHLIDKYNVKYIKCCVISITCIIYYPNMAYNNKINYIKK